MHAPLENRREFQAAQLTALVGQAPGPGRGLADEAGQPERLDFDFDKALAECKADKTWKTFETTTAGHDVMVDQPGWLADILLQVS